MLCYNAAIFSYIICVSAEFAFFNVKYLCFTFVKKNVRCEPEIPVRFMSVTPHRNSSVHLCMQQTKTVIKTVIKNKIKCFR